MSIDAGTINFRFRGERSKIALEDVRRLDVAPGDVLLVRLKGVPHDAWQGIADALEEALPDTKVLVHDGSLDDVTILTKEAVHA